MPPYPLDRHDALDTMPLTLDIATTAALRAALPDAGASHPWRVGHIAPVSLTVEGNACARRIRLTVDLYLVSLAGISPVRLRGQLLSASWAPLAPLPPVRQRIDDDVTPQVAAEAGVPLSYTLTEMSPPVSLDGGMRWLQYLNPIQATAGPDEGAAAPVSLAEALPQALAEWLTHGFPAATVEEATEIAWHGPVGHFGPVEALVLERSGQADLAVEATLLGEADNAAEQGGQVTTVLSLYGERHGAWLLHRRIASPVKTRNKQEPLPPPAFTHEVLVADSVEQLIDGAGLGRVEKRLFQQVGILPHATLWPGRQEDDGDVEEAAPADRSLSAMDLSGLADRPRRHLQAIASLAQQGRLSAGDIDLLLRTARHLSKGAR